MASSARIDELRKKFDENPRRYFAPLANEYRKAGDLEQAIFICQEYLPQQPGHMSGHIVYGQSLFELARVDEARAVFETALTLDPENLIALRHLGDIARQEGDLRGARVWYQRVLEADPRNEEIAQMMLTLLATPHGGQPAVKSGVAPLSSSIVSPFETAEGDDDAAVDSERGIHVEKSEDRSDLAIGPELSALPERQHEPEPQHEPEHQPEPVVQRSREALPEHELLDLDDFSVGEIPLSSLGGTPMSQPAIEAPSANERPADLSVETFPESAFTFAGTDAPFDADPFAIAATETQSVAEDSAPVADATESNAVESAHGWQPERDAKAIPDNADVLADSSESPAITDFIAGPPAYDSFDSFEQTRTYEQPEAARPAIEEFSADITLGLSDEGGTPGLSDPGDRSMLDGLESYSDPSFTADVPASLEVESFFDAPATLAEVFGPAVPIFEDSAGDSNAQSSGQSQDDGPESREAVSSPFSFNYDDLEVTAEIPSPFAQIAENEPTIESVVDATPAEAFVTETMAELYLQQGHLEAALDIYQKLVEQRPGDMQLLERLRAVEDSIHGGAVIAEPHVESPAITDDVSFTGPTIRDFLTDLLRTPYVPPARAPAPIAFEKEEPADEPIFGLDLSGPDVEGFASGFSDIGVVNQGSDAWQDPIDTESDLETTELEFSALDVEGTFDTDAEVFDAAPEPPTVAASLTPAHTTPSVSSRTPAYPTSASAFTATPSAAVAATPSPAIPTASPAPATPAVPPAALRPTPSGGLRSTPATPETVTGSIDALFSGADASSMDLDAATTLAQAFPSEAPEEPPLQGMPAHRASNELSLDHVFKANPTPRPESESDGFSFDQFFADDLGEGAPKDSTEPPAVTGQSPDDLAQFNNWLNGLKKT